MQASGVYFTAGVLVYGAIKTGAPIDLNFMAEEMIKLNFPDMEAESVENLRGILEHAKEYYEDEIKYY